MVQIKIQVCVKLKFSLYVHKERVIENGTLLMPLDSVIHIRTVAEDISKPSAEGQVSGLHGVQKFDDFHGIIDSFFKVFF